MNHLNRFIPLLGLIVLTACGGGNDPVPAPDEVPSMQGIAAVGAPIVGATVTARCADGVPRSTTTNASGAWVLSVLQAARPCALSVSGGNVNGAANTEVFHSFGSGSVVNLTPMTDLAIAHAVNTTTGQTLADWFEDAQLEDGFEEVSDNLAMALQALQQQLLDRGYNAPASFNPFTAVFAATVGDAYDDLLEAYRRGLIAAGLSYAQAVTAFTSGGNLPNAPEEDSGPGPDPEAAAGLDLVAIYAGTYTVTAQQGSHSRGTLTIAEDGSLIDFDDDRQLTVLGENVFNRIPNFPEEPRVQIEFFDDAPQQSRVRLFVDPEDTSILIRVAYFPDASTEDNATILEVQPPTP